MSEAPPRPAGFWIRTLALAIDLVIVMLVHASFEALATFLGGPDLDGAGGPHASVPIFTLVFAGAYVTVLHAVAGQTIGKSLTGVRVVALDGSPITLGPALLRYLAGWLSAFPLGLGFLMAGLRRDKRALHDLIAGTRVERPPARRRVVRRPVAPRPAAGTLQDPAVPRAGDPAAGAPAAPATVRSGDPGGATPRAPATPRSADPPPGTLQDPVVPRGVAVPRPDPGAPRSPGPAPGV